MTRLFLRLWRASRAARYRVGRWLIAPEAARIIQNYSQIANDKQGAEERGRERCAYISIGAQYVAKGWPNSPWDEESPFAVLLDSEPTQ